MQLYSTYQKLTKHLNGIFNSWHKDAYFKEAEKIKMPTQTVLALNAPQKAIPWQNSSLNVHNLKAKGIAEH
jgi:hypothetical protein